MSARVCAVPSYSFTCQRRAGHEGQHEYDDGVTRVVWSTALPSLPRLLDGMEGAADLIDPHVNGKETSE